MGILYRDASRFAAPAHSRPSSSVKSKNDAPSPTRSCVDLSWSSHVNSQAWGRRSPGYVVGKYSWPRGSTPEGSRPLSMIPRPFEYVKLSSMPCAPNSMDCDSIIFFTWAWMLCPVKESSYKASNLALLLSFCPATRPMAALMTAEFSNVNKPQSALRLPTGRRSCS